MSKGRTELKVGLFVLVLLGLGAVVTLKFSETGLGFGNTFSLTLRADNAGTVIKDSPVLMSGVKVGYVKTINLVVDQNGTAKVELKVELYEEYTQVILGQGAQFEIKSSGFLGDQYIAILPASGPPLGKLLEQVDWIQCEAPFDIEDVGKKVDDLVGTRVSSLMTNVENAVVTIEDFVKKIDQGLLSDQTLTNLAETIANFRDTSERVKTISDNLVVVTGQATNVVGQVENLLVTNQHTVTRSLNSFEAGMSNVTAFTKSMREALRTNAPFVHQSATNLASLTARLANSADRLDQYVASKQPQIDQAMTNIVAFSKKLEEATAELKTTLAANKTNVTEVVSNIAVATKNLKGVTASADTILQRLESGKGLAGGLLNDDMLRVQFQTLITNLTGSTEQFSILISNLTARGLFYKPKDPPLKFPRAGKPK